MFPGFAPATMSCTKHRLKQENLIPGIIPDIRFFTFNNFPIYYALSQSPYPYKLGHNGHID